MFRVCEPHPILGNDYTSKEMEYNLQNVCQTLVKAARIPKSKNKSVCKVRHYHIYAERAAVYSNVGRM